MEPGRVPAHTKLMFDPDQKKAQLEKLKLQAQQRSQLPPLSGRHSQPAQRIDIKGIMSDETRLAWYLQHSGMVKKAYEKKAKPPIDVRMLRSEREPGSDDEPL